MNAEQIKKIRENKECSNRVLARRLVNFKVNNVCGLSLDDLADSCEICDVIDTVEECLEGQDFEGAAEIVNTIDMDFIEENG